MLILRVSDFFSSHHNFKLTIFFFTNNGPECKQTLNFLMSITELRFIIFFFSYLEKLEIE
jgi:hypothetical protein